MLKIKSTFGNTAPDSHKPQKCCCTMAKFPWWKSDIALSLSSLLCLLSFLLTISSFPLRPSAFFLLSVFHFYSNPKYLKDFHFPPSASQALQKNVSVFLNTEGSSGITVRFIGPELVSFHYAHVYCTVMARNLLCHFPQPKLFTSGWRNRSSGLP